uniref:Bcl-x interacting BH3 domain-containing protein n=1 Tax=Gallus gallus TaxID=9031 RepID=A0A8V0Z3E3_CHICK
GMKSPQVCSECTVSNCGFLLSAAETAALRFVPVSNALFLLCAASRWRSHSLAEEIQPEIWIAQELRRIGDEFNASYCPRRVIFLFLLSISLRTVSKREKLNHIWKLALWQVFCSLKCRKGCAGGCRLLPPRH